MADARGVQSETVLGFPALFTLAMAVSGLIAAKLATRSGEDLRAVV
jgi:hypothetical protein